MPPSEKLPKEAEYREWLEKKRGASGRYVSDLVSRTRRVTGMIDLLACGSAEDVDVKLIRSKSFKACSGYVRSQIKRSAKLYVVFRAETKA